MPTTYAIPDGRTVMAATLYTGDGTSTKSFSNAVNGVSFQPDLVWQKIRSGTTQGTGVFDSIRGTTGQSLDTAATTSEGTWNGANASDYGYVSAFNSDGFSVNDGAIATTGGYVNYSGRTYVAWQWKAGGTAVSNTAGTITSSVSANTTAGFSVVTYTGNGSSSATVGHGLGAVPSMVIVKQRSGVNDWWVKHSSLASNLMLILDTTDATYNGTLGAGGGIANLTSSTTFGFVQGSTNVNNVNTNGQTFVAYCWAAVAGYSAFGSYVANASADGPFIYTGFRPRWIMLKRSSAAGAPWSMFDTSRNTYNSTNLELDANSSSAESTSGNGMDILSNGFKLRDSAYLNSSSGDTFVYAAFAENPLKYANAR